MYYTIIISSKLIIKHVTSTNGCKQEQSSASSNSKRKCKDDSQTKSNDSKLDVTTALQSVSNNQITVILMKAANARKETKPIIVMKIDMLGEVLICSDIMCTLTKEPIWCKTKMIGWYKTTVKDYLSKKEPPKSLNTTDVDHLFDSYVRPTCRVISKDKEITEESLGLLNEDEDDIVTDVWAGDTIFAFPSGKDASKRVRCENRELYVYKNDNGERSNYSPCEEASKMRAFGADEDIEIIHQGCNICGSPDCEIDENFSISKNYFDESDFRYMSHCVNCCCRICQCG